MLKINFRPADLAVGSRRIHYAWVMVGVASVMWTISTSIRFSATVLIPHLQAPDGLGWSYGAIALAFSLQWILTGITGPVMGWLGDRYGIRRTLVLGTVLFMAGMLLTGTMTQLWHFYLYFGLLLGAAMSVFQGPLVSGVTVWFRTSLGVAMGSFQAIQSLGTTLLIPLTAFLFARFGLTWTFWFPGLIGGVILLGLIRPFYNEPADIGLRPFGTPRDEPIRRLQRDDTAMIRTRVFLRHAKRTHAFWNLIGIHFWGCMGHNIFIVFLVAMAIERGLSRETAIGAYMTLTLFSVFSRFLVPILADWLGAKGVMVVCCALQVFPPVILLVAQEAWAFFLFAGLLAVYP